MKLALQIAAGIVIAGLVGWIFTLLLAGAAISTYNQQVNTALQATAQNFRVMEANEQARRMEYQQMQQRLAAAKQQRQIEAIQAQDAALQAAADEQAKAQAQAQQKATAWAAYYHAKPTCENPPDWTTTVDCGNAYMRAKRAFEARWSARADTATVATATPYPTTP